MALSSDIITVFLLFLFIFIPVAVILLSNIIYNKLARTEEEVAVDYTGQLVSGLVAGIIVASATSFTELSQMNLSFEAKITVGLVIVAIIFAVMTFGLYIFTKTKSKNKKQEHTIYQYD